MIIAKLSSSWQSSASQTDLALILFITTPTHPPAPGKVEIQLEIDYICLVDRWGMVWLTFTRFTGLNSEPTSYQLEWEVSAWIDWKLWVVEGS